MARRAASIWRAVKRPRPTALRPNSPKLTLLPRVATPVLRPFCSLRYFLLAGCSMLSSRLSYFLFWLSNDRSSSFLLSSLMIALIDPHLDADQTIGRQCLGCAVVNISTQCVQRHAALAIPLGTCDLDTVQTPRTHDLDALSTQTHCVLHRALHRTAEHDAL